RIEVALELVNDGPAPATLTPTAVVRGLEGEPLLALAGTPVEVAAGARASATLATDWLAPHQWTPATPVCYRAEAELRAGTVAVDRVGTGFGFREFTIKGKDFLLNGRRQVLLRNSWLTGPSAGPETVYEQLRGDLTHFNTLRLHLGFINQHTIGQADRAGMMIIPEFWAWPPRRCGTTPGRNG
ncbi:MAG: hypothetical protein L6R48_21070, partial [Planctomycetes bacterium]|nr:hypothetical protein [Planctomycetota bacterium]